MPEEMTEVAAPSAAEETPATPQVDPSRGALVDLSPEQRSEYKKTGVLPEKPKPEAPAPSPKKETPSETQPEADAGTGKQEHTERQPRKKHQTAEERIAQLEATIEKVRREAGIERKAEPAPAPVEPKAEAPQPPKNFQEWRKQFKPSAFIEEYAKQNPDASYEDAIAAMNDVLDDVRGQFRQAEEMQRTSMAKTNEKLSEAQKRYGEKFDDVLVPTLKAINDKIVPPIRQLLEECEVLPDLVFTIGDEEGGVEKFLAMPPGKQARYIALTEALIQEQLSGAAQEKPKPEPPAKPQTSAPKPPAEVGGRASSPEDALESAAKANDYRRFAAESTRRAIARMKG